METPLEQYDVLVVGAGPAGLTTAAGLARAGVRVLVVEKHAGTSIFPKAAGVRPRTMEILRSWGLDQRVYAAGQDVRLELGISPVLADPVVAVESLGAPVAQYVATMSPSRFAFVPQDHLEPVLLEHVQDRGGEVRFRTELLGFEVDGDGVRATLRPRSASTPQYDVRAQYLVGADGPRSTVRRALGIELEHLGSEGRQLTYLFAGDDFTDRSGLCFNLHRIGGDLHDFRKLSDFQGYVLICHVCDTDSYVADRCFLKTAFCY